MKRIYFAVTILIVLVVFVLVLPAFNLKIFNQKLDLPEIGLSYIKSGEYRNSVAAHLLLDLQDGEDNSLKIAQIEKTIKQRLELMEIKNSEVFSYKQGGSEIIRVKFPDDGEITDKRIEALTMWEKVKVYSSAPSLEMDDGGLTNEQGSGLVISDLDYDYARGAKMSFDTNSGFYVIEVDFDENQLDNIAVIVTSASAVAFSGESMPIAVVNTQFAPSKPKMVFRSVEGDSRQEALITLAQLGTRSYPVEVNLLFQETILAERTNSDLVVFGGSFILVYIVSLFFFYFRYRSALKFLAVALFMFSVLTLALMKLEIFASGITINLLISFIFVYIFAALNFCFLFERVGAKIAGLSSQTRIKVFTENYKEMNRDLKVMVVFLLFLLVVLRGFHSNFYCDFADGFGFGLVALLIISVFFLKTLFVNLYLEPFNVKDVFKKNSKK
ncbi:hypothetical protein JW796_02535 [Candidatus Dojkabacteria bacterium]|nr:hypothetical protein [Candidatus Dojkabacteria bacterium]